MKKLLAVFSLVFFIFPLTMISQELSDQEQEIWDMVKKEWKLWAEGNVDESLDLFHEQYLGWSNTNPEPTDMMNAKKSYINWSEKGEVKDYDIDMKRISVTDDAAVAHYAFTFNAVRDGEVMNVKGHYTEFYVKEEGKWKLFGDFTYMEDMK